MAKRVKSSILNACTKKTIIVKKKGPNSWTKKYSERGLTFNFLASLSSSLYNQNSVTYKIQV